MKKASLFCFLLFLTCGGAESDTIVIQDSSDVTVQDSSTTTIQDTTSSSLETTTTLQDTTTTSMYKNKCDDCEYVSINELISNINNVPKFAWNDYQRISNENNYFESESFEIILNVGPSTNLYFEDNEKYIQKGISFWQYFNLPNKYYAFFYNYDDLDWAINELTSTGFEGGMARAPCRDGICSGANSGIYQRPPHFGVGVFGIHSGDSIDNYSCLLYTSPSPRDGLLSRMPSSA